MNLHKFIRRICAAAVAAALTLSLCTPVLAEGIAALPAAETGGIPIDPAHFPDANFLKYVEKIIDTDHSGTLSQEERNATVIYVLGMGIKDLTGIEFFPELENLDCSENQLTQLDVSNNPNLILLDCERNLLTSLNVSKNTVLDALVCGSNKLDELDVSENPALKELYCSNNQLTSLNVSKNTELDTLDCSGNKRSLELSNSGRFDLSALKGFDVSKASGWSEGAAVDGNILTVPYGVTKISYQYDLGNGKSGTFTLTFDEVKEPDLPDDSSAPADTGSTAGGAIAAVAVGGAAVWGGYELVTRVMLHSLLPEGAAIPASRGQLALLVWNTAGRPEPVNAPAFADVTDPDTARAAQWCVEQGLLTLKKDGSFDPDSWTPKFRVIQVWNKAFPKQ